MDIHLIKEKEIEKCTSLMKECFDASYHSIFFLYPEHTLVATEGEELLGGINFKVYPVRKGKLKIGYIGWVYTAKAARGKGVARSLFDKGIEHMKSIGCTDIVLCIEGDNPSSFKNVATREGFGIQSLFSQLKRYHFSTFKVWKEADRFFDMGYFLWHYKDKENSLEPSRSKQRRTFLLMLLANTLLFAPKLLWYKDSPLYLLLPSLALTLRTLMLLLGGGRIFLSWDTAYLSGLLSAFLPFAFPVPGGVYPRGSTWSLKEKEKGLAIASLSAIASEVLLVLLFRKSSIALSFLLPLLTLDTLFPFYPFCGFLGSRVKRKLKKKYLLFQLAIIIFVILCFII